MRLKVILLAIVIGIAFGFSTFKLMHPPTLRGPQETWSRQSALDLLTTYDSIEEAAAYAGVRAYKCSHVYECAGEIAERPDGKFVVGPVHSDYRGDQVEMHHTVPAMWQHVADYHSHPCLPDSHEPAYFSPEDLGNGIVTRIPQIMVDLCTGYVHLFDPKTMRPDADLVDAAGVYLTGGKIVAQIHVTGESVEPRTGTF